MIAQSPQHKRRFPRVGLHLSVKYQVRGSPESDVTICDNISQSGLRIVSPRFIKPATAVMLDITAARRVVRPVGRVVWSSPLPHSDRNRIGIEFLELGHEEKEYLNGFIASAITTFKERGFLNRQSD